MKMTYTSGCGLCKSNFIGTYFDICSRLSGLFSNGFDDVLYGRFEKLRNVGAKHNEMNYGILSRRRMLTH